MTLFEELLQIRDGQREVMHSDSFVVSDKERPWEDSPHGRLKWYLHPSLPSICNAYLFNRQELPPLSKSGRLRSQGGTLFYMLRGSAVTRINDEVYRWSAGDLLTLPILRDGVVFQHMNESADERAAFISCDANTALSLGVDKGSGLELLEPAGPATNAEIGFSRDWPRTRAGWRQGPRPELDEDASQYDHDIERWKQIRERHEQGRLLIRGDDMTWEQNRQGKVRYYLNPDFEENALRDWTFFLHDIRIHTGKHRHQGGIVIYVVEGEGYTVCDGVRYDWGVDDMIMLPVKPNGVEHKHYNLRPGESCKWVAMFYWPWWELVASEFVQLELHPDFRERERFRSV